MSSKVYNDKSYSTIWIPWKQIGFFFTNFGSGQKLSYQITNTFTWKSRNTVLFLIKKRVNSPTKLVCSAFAFIFYWTGLEKVDNREQLETGVVVLKDAALHFLHEGASPGDAGVVLL